MTAKIDKFEMKRFSSKPVKVELQRIEKNFELYQSSDNKLGIYFTDEVSGEYEEWIKDFKPEEIRVAAQKLRSLLYGKVSQLPMICQGISKCVYKHSCPFKPRPPEGKMCPVESAFVIEKMNNYREELVVDSFRETDYTLVSRLVELELFDLRLSAMISSAELQNPMYEQFVGSTPQGEVVKEMLPNPMYEMKEKLSREKMKLLSVLVETPEARYKKQAMLKEVTENRYGETLKRLEDLITNAETQLLSAASEGKNER